MSRMYKVVIKDKDSGEELAARGESECNFLPVEAMRAKIQIKDEIYLIYEVTYIIEGDMWIQEIIIREANKLAREVRGEKDGV